MKKASLAARARSAKAVSPAPVWTAVQPAFGASAPGLHGSGRADPLAFLLGTAVAALFAGASASFARVPMADALVAFAPGGLEAMMVLAVVLGLDPLYVGVHHLARLLGIGFTVPFVVAWLQGGEPPKADVVGGHRIHR